MFQLRLRIVLILIAVLLPQAVLADFIFTAPPRESAQNGYKVYSPIAEFLTDVTGVQFIYRHQDTWSEYVADMRADKYDLVFDGPHFVDWRINNTQHRTLAKIPHLLQFRVITRKEETSINKLSDLVGKKACAPGSPNLGMLNLFNHFQNKDQQPIHVVSKGWDGVYKGVIEGKCVAGVLPKKNHEIYDKGQLVTRSIHNHLPYPNQAITAGKRISNTLRKQIQKALLSEAGHNAMENLRKRYTGGTKLVSAVEEEYDTIRTLLTKSQSFSHKLHEDKNLNQRLVNN